MLGKVLSLKDNKTLEAISMYGKALSIEPSRYQWHIELGDLYLKVGNKKLAIREFEEALNLNPNSFELKERIKKQKINENMSSNIIYVVLKKIKKMQNKLGHNYKIFSVKLGQNYGEIMLNLEYN